MTGDRNESGILNRRLFGAGAAALFVSNPVGQANARSTVAPKDMNVDGSFVGIIDIYDKNDQIDLNEAWRLGVRAIFHETGMGLFKRDSAYVARKAAALQKGFLWGAFHLLSSEPVEDQLDRFLDIENGQDGTTAMALDWEPSSHGTMTLENLRSMVTKFHERNRYYPMIYCDARVRNMAALLAGDDVLGMCKLWYARYTRNSNHLGIPQKTWRDYTLWQFDYEARKYGAPYPINVLPGADWSSFKGTEGALRTTWPFRDMSSP
jgi:lysozyme